MWPGGPSVLLDTVWYAGAVEKGGGGGAIGAAAPVKKTMGWGGGGLATLKLSVALMESLA